MGRLIILIIIVLALGLFVIGNILALPTRQEREACKNAGGVFIHKDTGGYVCVQEITP